MRTFIFLALLACLAAVPAAQRPAARGLEIYLIDVEGGNATLFVSPSGQSLLIDTGNGGAGRGPRRRPDHRRCPRRRAAADRPPDHDALSRRSLRRDGGAG